MIRTDPGSRSLGSDLGSVFGKHGHVCQGVPGTYRSYRGVPGTNHTDAGSRRLRCGVSGLLTLCGPPLLPPRCRRLELEDAPHTIGREAEEAAYRRKGGEGGSGPPGRWSQQGPPARADRLTSCRRAAPPPPLRLITICSWCRSPTVGRRPARPARRRRRPCTDGDRDTGPTGWPCHPRRIFKTYPPHGPVSSVIMAVVEEKGGKWKFEDERRKEFRDR